ncbi:MAG: bifunctional diaminohydroxyphosphoribosylaminopyrimidine deaminase/5-amino-6-(5-phosphoribosylamino)uracil reductase RibD [Bacteroides sp.]|nr:bifunctional diaminohydroxyphosphoribosylaminopyrimidine deaminase/5-amino-6-(5-phosphoribosylamino)uracil reductase RibD [Bacteroides sp.]
MNEEEKYMWRCIQLAKNGANHTFPNPMVGAVLVCDDQIIGEGYHIRYGEAHAEVNAIGAAKDPSLLERSTLYVSLEPCSHYGKTPPCSDLIIKNKIPRVVIGCEDPFYRVDGRGIRKLREAGCQVKVGVLEKECRQLIRRFITVNEQQRPYITLKWAESADGFIDGYRDNGPPAMLSTPLTSMLVHKRRTGSEAILVGTRTAFLDNPSLNVRNWIGKDPIRVVIDKDLNLPHTLNLFDGKIPTLVFTFATEFPDLPATDFITLHSQRDIPIQIVRELYRRGIRSLLVEGGAILLQSFIDEGLWDEVFIEKSLKKLDSGVKAPEISVKNDCVSQQPFKTLVRHYTSQKREETET